MGSVTINPFEEGPKKSLHKDIKTQDKEIEITSNGTTEVIPDSGFTGLEKVSVKVAIPTEEKTVDIAANGTTEIVAANGFLSKVSVNVDVPPSVGETTSVSPKDVNFYDYDGTLLYSYTWNQAKALTELPPLPTQKGLICQEWNYTLEDIKEQNGKADVGATYITDDGKTRIYITVNQPSTIPLYYSQTVSHGVIIDWGDGSEMESRADRNTVGFIEHAFEKGDYIITLDVIDSCLLSLGKSSDSYNLFNQSNNNNYNEGLGATRRFCITAFFSGKNIKLSPGVFYRQQKMKVISLSKDLQLSYSSWSSSVYFGQCYNLDAIIFPRGTTCIPSYATSNAISLKLVSIPNTVTTILDCAFQYCPQLTSICFPASTNSIDQPFSSPSITCENTTRRSIHIANKQISSVNYLFCSSLIESCAVPDNITSAVGAWEGCYYLYKISLPPSLLTLNNTFKSCYQLTEIDFSRHESIPTLSSTTTFDQSPPDREIIVPANLYSQWKKETNWDVISNFIVMDFVPQECLSLTISADDVTGNKTETTLHVVAICNGVTRLKGESVKNVKIEFTTVSPLFEQNTSILDTVEREITFTYLGRTATTSFNHLPYVDYKIKCKYNITSTSSATQLIYSSFSNYSTYFSRMIIDGVEYPISKTHIFDTVGEHDVEFDVVDNIDITNLSYLFSGIKTLTHVDCSDVDMSLANSTSSSNGTAKMFQSCTNLKKIVLPETLSYIGDYMFYGTPNVEELIIKAIKAPSIHNNLAFGSGSSYIGYNTRSTGTNKFYVPVGSEGYDTGHWQTYLYSTSLCGFTKVEKEF